MNRYPIILIILASISSALATEQQDDWTIESKQNLITAGCLPLEIIKLKANEKNSITIESSKDLIIGYRMNSSFDISKSGNFVMLSGNGLGECGAAVGVNGVMKPTNGQITINLHNRGKQTQQLILYKKVTPHTKTS